MTKTIINCQNSWRVIYKQLTGLKSNLSFTESLKISSNCKQEAKTIRVIFKDLRAQISVSLSEQKVNDV